MKRIEAQEAAAGDIVCLAGIEDITIGETITDMEHQIAIPPIAIDEPTVHMIFGVNTSPVAGREGQYVTSRQLKDRLDKELLGNVSIRMEPTDTPEQITAASTAGTPALAGARAAAAARPHHAPGLAL